MKKVWEGKGKWKGEKLFLNLFVLAKQCQVWEALANAKSFHFPSAFAFFVFNNRLSYIVKGTAESPNWLLWYQGTNIIQARVETGEDLSIFSEEKKKEKNKYLHQNC